MRLNPFYTLTLLLVSTLVYLLVLGIFVGTVALIVWSILDQAWLGLIIGVLLLALQVLASGRVASRLKGYGSNATASLNSSRRSTR